jgi:acetyl-CoA carboxylase carboxyltransferase component
MRGRVVTIPHASRAAPARAPASSPLAARERIELLCDPGSVNAIRSAVVSRRIGARARAGDGVAAACGVIDGRPVVCYAQDATFLGGSLGEAHAETIVRALSLARDARVPVIAFVQSAGARVQEATAALAGYGRIFRAIVALSGVVPQISIVNGSCAGGAAYAPALTDFVVMSADATMFLTGPEVVRAAIREDVTAQELGGARVHARTGLCDVVAGGDASAARVARELLSYLPQSAFAAPGHAEPVGPLGHDPSGSVPPQTRKVYDVRGVIRAIVDGGAILETSPRWARNMTTALARLEGRPVGIVANQPRYLGGVIDAEAARKAAGFVRTCDRFGLPLVVLVDTPGFLPGRRQEQRGVIGHGASLLRAFAEATVPRFSVVLRQAFGGAYITMNAKDLGADLAFAWPDARIGIMAASQAVGIVQRREIAAAADPAAHQLALSERYASAEQSAWAAASGGFIDEVVEPRETRARLCAALRTFATKQCAGSVREGAGR